MTCFNYDRIYAQYRNKEKAVKWFNIVPEIGRQFCEAYRDVSLSYDIDSNEGEQLNVIGRVIGIGRDFESTINLDQFLCDEDDALCGEVLVQCIPNSVPVELSDEYYRILLKAKVAKNTSDSTIDSIIEAVGFIIGDEFVKLEDLENMSFSITLSRLLTPIEREIFKNFDILPRPQGVKFLGYTELPATSLCNDGTECGDGSLCSSFYI